MSWDQGLELLSLVLDFVAQVAWPAILVIGFMIFRQEAHDTFRAMTAFIGRVKRAEVGGVTLVTHESEAVDDWWDSEGEEQ